MSFINREKIIFCHFIRIQHDANKCRWDCYSVTKEKKSASLADKHSEKLFFLCIKSSFHFRWIFNPLFMIFPATKCTDCCDVVVCFVVTLVIIIQQTQWDEKLFCCITFRETNLQFNSIPFEYQLFYHLTKFFKHFSTHIHVISMRIKFDNTFHLSIGNLMKLNFKRLFIFILLWNKLNGTLILMWIDSFEVATFFPTIIYTHVIDVILGLFHLKLQTSSFHHDCYCQWDSTIIKWNRKHTKSIIHQSINGNIQSFFSCTILKFYHFTLKPIDKIWIWSYWKEETGQKCVQCV